MLALLADQLFVRIAVRGEGYAKRDQNNRNASDLYALESAFLTENGKFERGSLNFLSTHLPGLPDRCFLISPRVCAYIKDRFNLCRSSGSVYTTGRE